MKVVCDSCGAKYSIPDDKVPGKPFKIRCKKCGASIRVEGGVASTSEKAGAISADAVWYVAVDGEQKGPLTPAQIGEMIAEGRVGWDVYVWREGFDDWKSAQDVPELIQAIRGGALSAGSPSTSEVPLVSGEVAAAKGPKDRGADLFGSAESGSGDEDVVASPQSAPSPRVSMAQAMTGQRNENSVLFSLSNLQSLSTASASSGTASSKNNPARPGMASGEGSGLIDIRALAAATGLASGSAPAESAPKLDDLLSIGAPSMGLGSALAAPVIVPEKPQDKPSGGGNAAIVAASIGGVAVLGAAGIIAFVLMRGSNEAPSQ
ncbi:MAG: zinc-ribbon domain-containing protein, partial [Sandaracinaceae bacterium]|nr:zinc-ribbon domain-containing protein [Sandaracinaceae bacterium]